MPKPSHRVIGRLSSGQRAIHRSPGGFVGSSAVSFAGISTGRALGFGFLIVAARLLQPDGYGLLAYALAVGNFTILLVNNAPNALATFLSRTQEPQERSIYFTNGLVFVALMLGISLVAIIPVALVANLTGWILVGLVTNLLGLTIYAVYREAQRGQARFSAMVGFYVLANLLQLVGIVVLGAFGLRSAALFLFIYGGSNLLALLILAPARPIGLPFVRDLVDRQHLRIVAGFTWPLCLQSAFWSVWFGADLALIRWLLPPAASGHYAAAKTLANVLQLVPIAVGAVLVPHMASRQFAARRRQTLGALLGTVGLMIPLAGGLVAFRHLIIRLAFGPGYSSAAPPLVWLAVAMLLDSSFLVLEASWSAMGRTRILPAATGAGMVVTVVTGFVLVRRIGTTGGAVAFCLGAAARLAWIGVYTVLRFRISDDPANPHPLATALPS